jgi:hypothetical protein
LRFLVLFFGFFEFPNFYHTQTHKYSYTHTHTYKAYKD